MSADEKQSEATAFAKEVRATFPVVHDPKSQLFEKFGALGVPANVVIDRSGKVVYSVSGEDLKGLQAAVARAMGGK